MDVNMYGMIAISVVAMLVLGILFLRKKMEVIVNMVLRGIAGCFAIYGINQILVTYGLSAVIGINVVTFLTSMILGIPGVCAMFLLFFL